MDVDSPNSCKRTVCSQNIWYIHDTKRYDRKWNIDTISYGKEKVHTSFFPKHSFIVNLFFSYMKMDHLFIHLDRHGLAFAKYRLFFTATNISRHLQSPTYLPIVFTNKTLNFCVSSNRKILRNVIFILKSFQFWLNVFRFGYQGHYFLHCPLILEEDIMCKLRITAFGCFIIIMRGWEQNCYVRQRKAILHQITFYAHKM